MKRIGRVASKISKGSVFRYNSYVVLIASLFSLTIFIATGATVIFALAIIDYISSEIMGAAQKDWTFVLTVCMVALTIVTGVFNIIAVSVNWRIGKILNDN